MAADQPLVIFDLDFTLWDCGGTYCDCLTPPFGKRHGEVYDRLQAAPIRLYDDVPAILSALRSAGHEIAVASRTHQPGWARELMRLLGIGGVFDYEEIYPGSKTAHLGRIAEDSGREFEEMVFFDDERRNIDEVSELGARCIHVARGVHWPLLRQAVKI